MWLSICTLASKLVVVEETRRSIAEVLCISLKTNGHSLLIMKRSVHFNHLPPQEPSLLLKSKSIQVIRAKAHHVST